MNKLKSLSTVVTGAACIALLSYTKAEAVGITQVSPSELTGTSLSSFAGLAVAPELGTNYDEIFESGGANFAERFVGQTLSFNGDSDVLSSTPTGPLALQVGSPGQNLRIFRNSGSINDGYLSGLGPGGFSIPAAGTGSLAVLFDFDQSEFGFDLLGGNNGSATVNFFRRNGSLVDTIVISNLPLSYYDGSGYSYGFRRDGGIKDIAGISIDNKDPAGIGVDNLRSDVPGVPGIPPTEIPFEFSPSLGILLLGAWGAIAQLNSIVKKRKSAEGAIAKN